jgi:phosphate transport system substrate-binding protein
MLNHPKCNIVVSGGQESGWPSFLTKESEICLSSLKIQDQELRTAKEQGMDVEEAIVGWGGIVIIVHRSNRLGELTADQVRKVFTGHYTNWNQLGASANEPISVYVVGEKRSETVEYMTREFLKASFGPYVMPKTYFRLIATTISEEPNSIGFVRFRTILQLKDLGLENKVKILAIKKEEQSPAVLPSRSTPDDGTYPLSRPYYLYLDKKAAGKLAKQFFDFCGNKNPRKR